eukprot:CAMPEP_0201671122 /NCGR_PEP_ID=MMETSP0494-20130426/28650_1 /ASSEMBLY_ACC=CAM_ASM_000839 /TAXON_ID=420259 /ORGANISM="Thalassiosira gravida, Strain GMp14c1" /LENGTH=150 /DNA_ID=CAMNT_0048152385 /DNA_START=36 /DNA_END=488 /DNA_ORIENTATION=+
MSGMPSNIAPANVAASEVPDGFSLAGPGGNGGGASAGGGGGANNQAQQQRDAQRQSILEQAMTPDALARLRRVKLVKKERANAVESMIANMALQGKIDTKVTEGKLIEMLEGIVGAQAQKEGNSAKISFQRKKYTFDSDDDDDDNDDDLL